MVEWLTYSQRVTVYCSFWHDGIICLEQAAAVAVNDERSRIGIIECLHPKVEENVMDDEWFQGDGAICHTANVIIDRS